MNDINKVFLIGRICLEPKFGYTQQGAAKLDFSIAVNRSKKDQSGQYVEEGNFFNLSLWGKTAENLKQYLYIGQQVAIDGQLKQDTWTDDGQKHSKISIVVDNIQMLGGKNQNQQQNQNNQQRQGNYYNKQQSNNYRQQSYNPPAQQNGMPFPDEIPF